MSYTACGSLQPGDVVLVQGRSTIDRLIRWATCSPFSHAALVGRGCLLEANWPRVRTVPIDAYAADGWVYRVRGATPAQRDAAVAAARARLGQPYGLGELADDAARDVLRLPLWPRAAPRYLTCSGLVAAVWAAAGVRITWAPWPSPMDLAESPLLIGPRPWQQAS